jgi:hypothetical protein
MGKDVKQKKFILFNLKTLSTTKVGASKRVYEYTTKANILK